MGCNAWNHPPGCDCGWGGDTGTFSATPSVTFSIPKLRLDTLDGFTEPNASCPVCGASVYYYRSPYGGSVYFDALGPPWPKHPCTDHPSPPLPGSAAPSSEREPGRSENNRTDNRRIETEPLLRLREVRVDGRTFLVGDLSFDPFSSVYLPVDRDGWSDGVVFWRFVDDRLGYIELDGMLWGGIGFERVRTTTPVWLRGSAEASSWRDGDAPPSERLLNIAHHMLEAPPLLQGWLRIVMSYLDAEVKNGSWRAFYLLARLHAEGRLVKRDLALSFDYADGAANSKQPLALRLLADHYEKGWGVSPDPAHAAYLRAVAPDRWNGTHHLRRHFYDDDVRLETSALPHRPSDLRLLFLWHLERAIRNDFAYACPPYASQYPTLPRWLLGETRWDDDELIRRLRVRFAEHYLSGDLVGRVPSHEVDETIAFEIIFAGHRRAGDTTQLRDRLAQLHPRSRRLVRRRISVLTSSVTAALISVGSEHHDLVVRRLTESFKSGIRRSHR